VSSAPKKSSAGKSAESGEARRKAATNVSESLARPLPVSRYVTFLALAMGGCAADLATKHVVFRWLGIPAFFLDPDQPDAIARWRGDRALAHLWYLYDQRLGIQTSLNTGAVFGLGGGFWWLFAIFAVVTLIGIVTWLFYFRAAADRWLTVTLGMITGGILGNLHDRLGLWDTTGLKPAFQHAVRDWILFQWPESGLPFFNPWPNFNIADSLLVTGAIMLVVHAMVWREPPKERDGGLATSEAKK
jgi:signal peptidase II